MYRWEQLEQHLNSQGVTSFTCDSLAYDLGIYNSDASNLIQGYLYAQRQPYSATNYVLSRKGRTRAAVWHVGDRKADLDRLTQQCISDIGVKLHDALAPDLNRLQALNPKLAQLANNTVAALEANFQLMTTAIP